MAATEGAIAEVEAVVLTVLVNGGQLHEERGLRIAAGRTWT